MRILAFSILLLTANATLAFAQSQFRHPTIDRIIEEALYLDENEERRLQNWTIEGLWNLYRNVREHDPEGEYYRTHYIHLMYLNQIYEDRRGVERCIDAATNAIIRGRDNPVIKQNHIFRYWPDEKQIYLNGLRQQEIFYAYWDLVNFYMGLNEYETSLKYTEEYKNAGNRIFEFQATALKLWHEFSLCDTGEEFRELLDRVREESRRLRRDSSPIYADWWYRRQKTLNGLMLRNIEGGILARTFQTRKAIDHYHNILRDIERIKLSEGFDLFDNAYIENLTTCYYEDFNFEAVRELYLRYINHPNFALYNYTISARFANVLISQNRLPEAVYIMNGIADRDKQGNIAIAMGYLGYLSGDFDFSLDNLVYASRYQQAFMFTTYDTQSHNYLIYNALSGVYGDYNNYLRTRNGWLARPVFLKNNLASSYYRLLAADNLRRVKTYLNEYSHPPTLPFLVELARHFEPRILERKINRHKIETDIRERSHKYYDLTLAYSFLEQRNLDKARQYLNSAYAVDLIEPEDEALFLGLYHNAKAETAKLSRNNAEYQKNVLEIYRHFPQFIPLKGRKMTFRCFGARVSDDILALADGTTSRNLERLVRKIDRDLRRWRVDFDNSAVDFPLIGIEIVSFGGDNDGDNGNEISRFAVRVSVELDGEIITGREIPLNEFSRRAEKRLFDDIFNAVFNLQKIEL